MRWLLATVFGVTVTALAVRAQAPTQPRRIVIRDPDVLVCVPYEGGLSCVDRDTLRSRILSNGRDDCE